MNFIRVQGMCINLFFFFVKEKRIGTQRTTLGRSLQLNTVGAGVADFPCGWIISFLMDTSREIVRPNKFVYVCMSLSFRLSFSLSISFSPSISPSTSFFLSAHAFVSLSFCPPLSLFVHLFLHVSLSFHFFFSPSPSLSLFVHLFL